MPRTDSEITLKVSTREFATILAALRCWQRLDSDVLLGLSTAELKCLLEISTNQGEHLSLSSEEIDNLVYRINCD